jgi:transposase-like protein
MRECKLPTGPPAQGNMPRPPSEFDLRCFACGWMSVCGPAQMTDWLLRHRLIKRTSDIDTDMLAELFRSSAGKFVCPQCGQSDLAASPSAPLDSEAWGEARKCETCGAAIPPERLEVFPETRLCVACQNRDERGELTATPEYCPRCGSAMELSQSRGSGITRYVMTCRSCGRKM